MLTESGPRYRLPFYLETALQCEGTRMVRGNSYLPLT
jgi:hypothetical protein